MIYFTADLHLGHENIIRYCSRPFSGIAEMDAEIIGRENYLVQPNDTLFVLGDFCWGDPKPYLQRLTGRVLLVPGCHDKKCKGAWVLPKIHELKFGDQVIVLCHYPMLSWPKSHHGAWHLYGHSHTDSLPFRPGKAMNVGVDRRDFWPVSLTEVLECMRGLPDNWNLIRRSS